MSKKVKKTKAKTRGDRPWMGKDYKRGDMQKRILVTIKDAGTEGVTVHYVSAKTRPGELPPLRSTRNTLSRMAQEKLVKVVARGIYGITKAGEKACLS